MLEKNRQLRGHDFLPANAGEVFPHLYATEDTSAAEKVLHAHFFIGGMDWYLAEFSADEAVAFGWVCLGDERDAEWGYFSLDELEDISTPFVVERDLQWVPGKASECLPERAWAWSVGR
ncbi:DUF2958 domain-containing protein [Curtobacterium flaccumfaciens]|uniref:DUF2958 domain-containing protein n=1 Tax=Curtobacterium flaccumfaciens TaxID=2035 RepID=UPI00387A42E6